MEDLMLRERLKKQVSRSSYEALVSAHLWKVY